MSVTAAPPTGATDGDVTMTRPPLLPFTLETVTQKVRVTEDAWNTRNPERVAGAYTEHSRVLRWPVTIGRPVNTLT